MKADLLDRKPFVELLDSIITKKIGNNQGFSFAIDGKWGCGKSYILKQLEESLNSRYLVIHYNCWENDYYEEPLVAILSVIIDKLNSVNSPSFSEKSRRRKEIAIKFLRSAAGMLINHATGLDFAELSKAGAEAIAAGKEPVFSKSFDPNLPLKECIKIVQDQLSLLKIDWKGVVLIVDELDRCLPEYAIKVLERLHHICYCTDSDSYIFVQLMAINRDELANSISKVFNRLGTNKWNHYIHFSTQEGKNNLDGEITGITEDVDSYEKQDVFSNYYFQKFLQMIIPVPFERENAPMLAVLNGFEKEFIDNGIVNIEFVEKFFNIVMIDFPIRIKEELVEKVKIIHQITVERRNVKYALSYGILCVELLDILFGDILKKQVRSFECNEDQDAFWFKVDSATDIPSIKKYNRFTSALRGWSNSKMCMKKRFPRSETETACFKLDSAANYVKAFYCNGIYQCEDQPQKEEYDFILAFRDISKMFFERPFFS